MNNFPILKRQVYGNKLIYLDNAATTQKPEIVLQAMDNYYRDYNANVHRGIHLLAEEATVAYEKVREQVAKFINAESEEIIFTKSTTESLNLLAYSLTQNLKKNDEIILTVMEHHSNLVPWQQLAKQRGLVIKYVPIKTNGELKLDTFNKLLTKKTKIVSLTHLSNVLGTINPIKEIAKKVHSFGATLVVDAAQSVPFMQIDVKELNCDYLAFSGHKMYGPTGVGVLYGKKTLLEKLPPFLYGGDMIEKVTLKETTFNTVPYKFEAGTPNIAEVIGLGAAIKFLQEENINTIKSHEEELTKYALKELNKINSLTVYGPQKRGPLISFTIKNVHPHDITALLDKDGIASRAGHLCAMPLLQELNVDGVIRVSFGVYNTKEEIDFFIKSLNKAIKVCNGN
ncbi:cysteine desulfurase [Candidatus Woesearchaeota archaeon]|jgi:cysteine desulfurase / selenocysteine lyase|nr:cysteine desulfurase [Candidatus Woesearchaeota archaeon]MBT5740371.1 cysteine desulfurase [Candidatus Woesearchaeota archaeon]